MGASAPAGTVLRGVPDLVASRSLGVLDELRVPYRVHRGDPDGAWASLSAGGRGRTLLWYVGSEGPAGWWSFASTPIFGRLAPPDAVRTFAQTLGGTWHAEEAITAPDGEPRPEGAVWRSHGGDVILPFDPDELVANLRAERYRGDPEEHPAGHGARRAYYSLRPLMPRRLQLALRRAFTRVQERASFPRWPVEPALHDLIDLVTALLVEVAGPHVPCIAPWPAGRRWALVLTHDVETAAGRDAIERVRAVERAAGVRSSWNLVPERYEVPDALVERLRREGCEVGVHGLRHDGRDLESLETLEQRLPEMRRWAERWGAAGFRSPATHRRWEWMPRLGFDYDSSYPDTDPYEPMPGGCCTWLPFFNDDLVELPITLPQDHTTFVILRRDESLWRRKADVLRERGGMALLIVHPDYMLDDARLEAYERFLAAFRDDPEVWIALPGEVAAWWRRRAATALHPLDGQWVASGPAMVEVAVGELGASGTPAPAEEPRGAA
jgi:hypothetical protein